MTKSQRLKPVIRVSESKERGEAVLLGQSLEALRGQERRLDELRAYLDEYRRLFNEEGVKGLGVRRLHSYRGFIVRLTQAVDYQHRRVEEARQEYERQKRAWQAARIRCQALDKVATKHLQTERRDRDRREQREADDRNPHRHPDSDHRNMRDTTPGMEEVEQRPLPTSLSHAALVHPAHRREQLPEQMPSRARRAIPSARQWVPVSFASFAP